MKKIITCITVAFVLAGCLCGCARNDEHAVKDNSMPVVTSSPNILPQPDNGTVTDSDGVIGDVEEDMQNRKDNKDAEKDKVTASPSASPAASTAPTASASPAATEKP